MEVNAVPFGIGSLPWCDERQAAAHVREFYAEFPFVPQLPLRGPLSQMVTEPFQRYSDLFDTERSGTIRKGRLEDLVAIGQLSERDLRKFHLEQSKRSDFDEALFAVRAEFKIADEQRLPIAKAQMIGPATLFRHLKYGGNALNPSAIDGRALLRLYYDELSMRIVELGGLAERRVFVLDEPALPFLPRLELLRSIELIGEAARRIRASGAQFGIHCCASLQDEGVAAAVDAMAPDLICAPWAFGDNSSAHPSERRYVSHGSFAFGICPTDSSISAFDPIAAAEALRKDASTRPPEPLLISASCGLGFSGEDNAVLIGKALRRVCELLST